MDKRTMMMHWTTDVGDVVFTFPSHLSMHDVSDVHALLDLTLRGMERRAAAREPAEHPDMNEEDTEINGERRAFTGEAM